MAVFLYLKLAGVFARRNTLFVCAVLLASTLYHHLKFAFRVTLYLRLGHVILQVPSSFAGKTDTSHNAFTIRQLLPVWCSST